jgi:hypothetical protein
MGELANSSISLQRRYGGTVPARIVNPIRRRRTLNRVARGYLEFKHRFEFLWELCEGMVIVAVLTLAVVGRESLSHRIELASHILIGLLLFFKLASIVCAYVVPRSSGADSAGVET